MPREKQEARPPGPGRKRRDLSFDQIFWDGGEPGNIERGTGNRNNPLKPLSICLQRRHPGGHSRCVLPKGRLLDENVLSYRLSPCLYEQQTGSFAIG